MSDEDFLSRWSRRKREAAQPVRSTAQPATSAGPGVPSSGDNASVTPPEARPATAEDEFDLASLPPIESITATTDVTAFLRPGVPLELRRAALRRAWEADPAIRDFIGPAENAWDFNDPNAMSGFGPLDQTPEQVREMAAKIVGRVRDAMEGPAPADEKGLEKGLTQHATESQSEQIAEQSSDSQSSAAVEPPVTGGHIASFTRDTPDQTEDLRQRAAPHNEQPVPRVRRMHGRALPR
ncbi:MAG: DUF3306 domain-containing protein [Hyphomicrobiaceae bacterium]